MIPSNGPTRPSIPPVPTSLIGGPPPPFVPQGTEWDFNYDPRNHGIVQTAVNVASAYPQGGFVPNPPPPPPAPTMQRFMSAPTYTAGVSGGPVQSPMWTTQYHQIAQTSPADQAYLDAMYGRYWNNPNYQLSDMTPLWKP